MRARRGARGAVSPNRCDSLARLAHPPGLATGGGPASSPLTAILPSVSASRHRTSEPIFRVVAAAPQVQERVHFDGGGRQSEADYVVGLTLRALMSRGPSRRRSGG